MNSGEEAEGKEKSKKFIEKAKYMRKYARANSGSRAFGKFKSFIRGQFSGVFVSLLANHLALSLLAN